MQKTIRKHRTTTLYKYLLSYILILSILSIGYFCAFRVQLKNVYTNELHAQADEQLNNIRTDLNSAITTINQIQSLLKKDIDLILSRYTNENWYLYQASKKFTEYAVANDVIETICYVHLEKDQQLSTGNHVRKTTHGYEIYCGQKYIPLPLEEHLNSSMRSQLLLLGEGNSRMLIYLPHNDGIKSYSIFYILHIPELENLLNRRIGLGISSICLLNEENTIVTGYAPEILEPHMLKFDPVSNPTFTENNETIHSITGLLNGYSLVTVVSNEAILQQVTSLFEMFISY